MRGYVSAALAVAVLSLTQVKGQDLINGETGKLLASTSEEVNSRQTNTSVPDFGARHVIFRPLPATRQRNRELERRLLEQRKRSKSKSSRRGSTKKGQSRAKSLNIANQYEESDKDFEIPKTVLPLSSEDDALVTDPLPDEVSSQHSLSLQQTIPTETFRRADIRKPVSQNFESGLNSVNFLLNRPRRNVNSKSSELQTSVSPQLKSHTPFVKDTDDIRPSPNIMLMFSKPDLNRQVREASQNNTAEEAKDIAKEKLNDDDPMETAETVLFHPLFVHRYRKAQKNLRRQSQMRRQNRPKKKPKKPQTASQQRPTARPQQISQSRPQRPNPQRPAQSSSQNIRRGQYYYVAAAGPFGQWVYYPVYYY